MVAYLQKSNCVHQSPSLGFCANLRHTRGTHVTDLWMDKIDHRCLEQFHVILIILWPRLGHCNNGNPLYCKALRERKNDRANEIWKDPLRCWDLALENIFKRDKTETLKWKYSLENDSLRVHVIFSWALWELGRNAFWRIFAVGIPSEKCISLIFSQGLPWCCRFNF